MLPEPDDADDVPDVPSPGASDAAPKTETYLLCVENYRQTEAQHDAEDYFVDGIVLLRLPLPVRLDRSQVEDAMKKVILQLQAPENRESIQESFPKFHALREAQPLWWYHLMRRDQKERLPKDFHTNQFTEEELLGTAPSEDPDDLPREMWFDRDGDPIEGPPDRMMALLYT